ncbi:hypothetical protein D3C75_1025140 [compost metagenome]
MALLTRLTSTWPSRSGSPRRKSGTAGDLLMMTSICLRSARSANMAARESSCSLRSKSISSSVSLPDSTLVKSRMSLMSNNKVSDEDFILLR